jgi:hypothetical protein
MMLAANAQASMLLQTRLSVFWLAGKRPRHHRYRSTKCSWEGSLAHIQTSSEQSYGEANRDELMQCGLT